MAAIARVIDLVKTYQMEEVAVHALCGVTLDFEEGDFIALMGPSGSGKSTLLNLLGCLDRCSSGHYYLGGQDVAYMDDDQLSDVRGRHIGFIFQSYNLLPQYTVVENIEIPLLYRGIRLTEQTKRRCIALAEMVGLGERLDHRPTQLSGGQQQQRRDRAQSRERSARDPRRRADRQPRLEDERRDHADAAEPERGRQDDHHGDPRERHRRLGPPRGPDARRAHRVGRAKRPSADGVNSRVRDADGPRNSQRLIEKARFAMFSHLIAELVVAWMKWRSSFVLAFRSLWLHKLRSILSVLGIIIGIAAVITLMGFGKGSMEDALERHPAARVTTNVIVRRAVKPLDAGVDAAVELA